MQGNDTEALERFWSRVICGLTPDDCWQWTGQVLSRSLPYGRVRWQGRMRMAHHVSYLIHVGPIPKGKILRHRCPGGGNANCLNPRHLKPGTRRQNALDTLADGRHWSQTGVWHPSARERPAGVVGETRELVLVLQRTIYRRLTTLAQERGISLHQLAAEALGAI